MLENLLDLAWKYRRSTRRTVVLFVVHPADYQDIKNRFPESKPPNPFITTPNTMMGTPVWKTPKIEQGVIRSYYSWESAYNDLKDILEPKDVEFLKTKMETERELYC